MTNEPHIIEVLAPILTRCIKCLLYPVYLTEKGIRILCHFILSKTHDERWILRKRGTLRFKVEAHKRTRYYTDCATFRIAGKNPVVLDIPKCLSLGTARAICAAQHIDPWFADELLKRVEIDWPAFLKTVEPHNAN